MQPKQPNAPGPRHTPAPVSSLPCSRRWPVVACLRVSTKVSLTCRLLWGSSYVVGPCVLSRLYEEAGRGREFSTGHTNSIEVTKGYVEKLWSYLLGSFAVHFFPTITLDTVTVGMVFEKRTSSFLQRKHPINTFFLAGDVISSTISNSSYLSALNSYPKTGQQYTTCTSWFFILEIQVMWRYKLCGETEKEKNETKRELIVVDKSHPNVVGTRAQQTRQPTT